MAKLESTEAYRAFVRHLFATKPPDEAASEAVGFNYEALGRIEADLLRAVGLRADSRLIDVGCGAGRLAWALRDELTGGSYLGTDVSPELLAYARARCPERFVFQQVERLEIPAADASADVVSFFSVFTHILHEESYCYLREAVRALAPEGRIVFSFIDFTLERHWRMFEAAIDQIGEVASLLIFMTREMIECWCRRLDLEIELIQDGGVPFIELSEPVTFDDGTTVSGTAALGPIGQSVAVLRRARSASTRPRSGPPSSPVIS